MEQEFGAEWLALELLAGRPCPGSDPYFLRRLLSSPDLKHGELLENAFRQKLIYRLSAFIAENAVVMSNAAFREALATLLQANVHRTIRLRDECVAVSTALQDCGVRFACTKGIIFESALYGANGSRAMRDVDFMIAPESRPIVVEVMTELGFKPGRYNASKKSIELDRRTELQYRMNPDHLPHFSRLNDDLILPCVMVDFANSFTWTNSSWQIPVELCLAQLRLHPVPGRASSLPRLSAAFELLFTILHIFREAWLQQAEGAALEVDLMRFADVVLCVETQCDEITAGEFRNVVQEYKLTEPVLWVLEHIDRTLGTDLVESLELSGLVSDDWLASARAPGGRLLKWSGTMRERLHDPAPRIFV